MREFIFRQLDITHSIETDRLILRRLTQKDAAALYNIACDARVSKYLLWDPHPGLSYTKKYLKNLMRLYASHTYCEWGVYRKDDNALIGTCGFTAFDFLSNNAEIGYSFGVPYWGQGYATEAVTATIRYGFETLHLARISACYAMENHASTSVLEKCGMHFLEEGERLYIKGKEHHIGIHAITEEEYVQRLEKIFAASGIS